jgi:hypothetical protein
MKNLVAFFVMLLSASEIVDHPLASALGNAIAVSPKLMNAFIQVAGTFRCMVGEHAVLSSRIKSAQTLDAPKVIAVAARILKSFICVLLLW